MVWSTAETTASITVGTAGSYTVTQTVGGCTSLPGTGVANPTAIPTAPVVTVVDNCGTSTLTATGTNLVWSTAETTASITVGTAGSYTVTQTVGGCVSLPGTGVANPTVAPSAPVVTVVDNCGNSTLTATGMNHVWSTAETTSIISVLGAGTYTVTQTVGGCTSLAGTGVANPLAVPTPPTITAGGTLTFCDGDSVDLVSSVGINIIWSSAETTQTITATSSGTYTVMFTDLNGCSSTSLSTIVTEIPLPVVSITPYADLCENDPFFTITGGSPSGGSYSGPGITGGIFNPAGAGVGVHVILYEFTDANGCYNVDSTTITVADCWGIDELTDIGLTLYPNPAFSSFTIATNGAVIQEVKIYDASGRLIDAVSVNSDQQQIDVSAYASGMYTVQVQSGNELYRERFMKQ